MSVTASARARVLGLSVSYVNMMTDTTFLPQRVGVLAQGTTAMAGYSLAKAQFTNAYDVGNTYGFGSPAHLIARELWPDNGAEGIGGIPVEFLPLADGTTAATCSVTPSGTSTAAGTYYLRAGGVSSDAFTIAAGALATPANLSEALREMYVAAVAVTHFPLTLGFTYDTVTETHAGNTGNGAMSGLTATTPCLPGVWTLVCTAEAADAGTFTLTDPEGTVISQTVTIGATDESGLAFTLADGAEDFDIGDTFLITVPGLTLTGTTKWKGASANSVEVEVVDALGELVFTIVQPNGGATNPTVDTALAQIGTTWTTMLINALEIADTTALTTIAAYGETRWATLVHKPLFSLVGNTIADRSLATAVCDTYTTDRTNAQIPSPGSPDLPCRVAARAAVEIAKRADSNPAWGYAAIPLTGLIPGTDAEQWEHTDRDLAVKAGSSTVLVDDGVVKLNDTRTFYHPAGNTSPAYSKLVTIVKLQNAIYNYYLPFSEDAWAEAPLIPTTQKTKNPAAKKPLDVVAELITVTEGLGNNAIISDPETAKGTATASINSSNPDRLDWSITIQVSGNTIIIDGQLNFGQFYGA